MIYLYIIYLLYLEQILKIAWWWLQIETSTTYETDYGQLNTSKLPS